MHVIVVDAEGSAATEAVALIDADPAATLVGVVEDVRAARALCADRPPDIVVVGATVRSSPRRAPRGAVRPPDAVDSPLEAAHQLRDAWPSMVLVLCTPDASLQAAATNVGVDAFAGRGRLASIWDRVVGLHRGDHR